MNFVNNYIQPVILAQGVTTAQLALADGEYRLTLTDPERTRREIVGAAVTGGTATLTRALEGTADQIWPDGSEIYCDVTAGILDELYSLQPAPGGSASVAIDRIEQGSITLSESDWNSYSTVGVDGGDVVIECGAIGAAPIGTTINFVLLDTSTVRFNNTGTTIVLRNPSNQVLKQFAGTAHITRFGDLFGFPLWVLSGYLELDV